MPQTKRKAETSVWVVIKTSVGDDYEPYGIVGNCADLSDVTVFHDESSALAYVFNEKVDYIVWSCEWSEDEESEMIKEKGLDPDDIDKEILLKHFTPEEIENVFDNLTKGEFVPRKRSYTIVKKAVL